MNWREDRWRQKKLMKKWVKKNEECAKRKWEIN